MNIFLFYLTDISFLYKKEHLYNIDALRLFKKSFSSQTYGCILREDGMYSPFSQEVLLLLVENEFLHSFSQPWATLFLSALSFSCMPPLSFTTSNNFTVSYHFYYIKTSINFKKLTILK